MIKYDGKEYRSLPEQVAKNAEDIKEIKKSGVVYTASNGIKIVEGDIRADTSVLATLAYANTAAAQAAHAEKMAEHIIKIHVETYNKDLYFKIYNYNKNTMSSEEILDYLTNVPTVRVPLIPVILTSGQLALTVSHYGEYLAIESLVIEDSSLDIDNYEATIGTDATIEDLYEEE